MDKHKLRIGVAKTAAVSVAALSATLIFATAAGATIPPDPYGGSDTVTSGSPPPSSPGPQPPQFYNGNVEQVRGTGSDTTFFLMQKVSDLFTSAGLYGCSLNGTAGENLFNTSGTESSTTSTLEFYCGVGTGTAPGFGTVNISSTDTADNWDRTEVVEGVDAVGSGNGQNQLCNALSSPLPVDFARSSKPASTACGTGKIALTGTGYAKDGVPPIDWTKVNPTTYGKSSTYPYNQINNAGVGSPNAGVVGPVAAGWMPGDPNTGPYTGYQLATISNTDNGGGTQQTAYRMWCASPSATGASEEITDWGELSNLGGTTAHTLEVQVALTSGSPTATFIRLDTGFGTTTNASTTVLDPQAVASDLNDPISGGEIQPGTTITAVTAGTGYTISLPALGTDTRENFAITGGGNFPSTVANGQTITAPDITGGTATISSGAGTNQLTLSANASATVTDDARITTPTKLAQGDGVPIGVPIRIDGINTGSGTQQTFATFADLGGTGCGSAQFGNFNQTIIAQDPNPTTRVADNASTRDLLENNSDQIDQFASTDFPSDAVDQAIEAATSIYVISFGVQKGTPTDANVNIDSTGAVPVVGNPTVTSYGGNLLALNGTFASAATEVANSFATARTLWNVYNPTSVRASTGGFLNWMCDANTNFIKGTDNSTQQNFDTELGNLISSVFFFPRNSDTTQPPPTGTPGDGIASPNNTCAATLNISTTAGSPNVTLTAGGAFPVDVFNSGSLPGNFTGTGSGFPSVPANSVVISDASGEFPSGTYVSSGASTEAFNSGTSTWTYTPSLTLTMSQNAAATTTGDATVFYGVPAITSVGTPNT